ncbi:hypothetical protein Tco_1344415 [Tanacetum coccineum]
MGGGFRVADSYTGNHPKCGFTPLETIRRLLVVIGRRSYSGFEGETFKPERRDVKVVLPKRSQALLDAPLGYVGLKTTWKHSPKRPLIYHRGREMDFISFMLGGVDGELNFLHAKDVSEGQNSPSTKSVINNVPMIDATPLSSVYPLNIVENVVDFDDPSYGEDEQTLVGPSLPPHPEASKKLKILGKLKVVGEASTPLDVDSNYDIHEFPSAKELKDATDYHWVVAHVTLPFWKQHLRDISIEQLGDFHDRAYMRQAVLDIVLNSRTRELFSTLHKAKTSYDVIRARELDKDRAYAELERKYNEALQDLDKNPLISDMHAEIKALQGQVDSLHRFKIKGIESERRVLKSSAVNCAGVLIAKLVRSSIIYGRCQAFEEVAAMKEPFVLEKMSGYQPSPKEEYDQAGDALANASYPFLAEYVINPYASLEQLLSKKPPLLRPTLSRSHSKPLSSKFRRRPTAKGVGLRVADSHTGNRPESGFTPLETIRRLLVVIGRRSHSGFEEETFESEWRVRHQDPRVSEIDDPNEMSFVVGEAL